jgi:hypothetical protein
MPLSQSVKASMTRLFKSAAGMGLPSSRCGRLGQAHAGEIQKRRYTNLPHVAGHELDARQRCVVIITPPAFGSPDRAASPARPCHRSCNAVAAPKVAKMRKVFKDLVKEGE